MDQKLINQYGHYCAKYINIDFDIDFTYITFTLSAIGMGDDQFSYTIEFKENSDFINKLRLIKYPMDKYILFHVNKDLSFTIITSKVPGVDHCYLFEPRRRWRTTDYFVPTENYVMDGNMFDYGIQSILRYYDEHIADETK